MKTGSLDGLERPVTLCKLIQEEIVCFTRSDWLKEEVKIHFFPCIWPELIAKTINETGHSTIDGAFSGAVTSYLDYRLAVTRTLNNRWCYQSSRCQLLRLQTGCHQNTQRQMVLSVKPLLVTQITEATQLYMIILFGFDTIVTDMIALV